METTTPGNQTINQSINQLTYYHNYSAYYCYLYAEILDADAFEAFKETGNVFDKETADRVRKFIYSSGNTMDPRDAFRHFRGRDAVIEPMMKKKGLLIME